MKHVNSPDRTDLSLSKLQQPQIKTRLSQTLFTSCNRSMVHGSHNPLSNWTWYHDSPLGNASSATLAFAAGDRLESVPFPEALERDLLATADSPCGKQRENRKESRLGKQTKFIKFQDSSSMF